jgi:hypothetical protein
MQAAFAAHGRRGGDPSKQRSREGRNGGIPSFPSRRSSSNHGVSTGNGVAITTLDAPTAFVAQIRK